MGPELEKREVCALDEQAVERMIAESGAAAPRIFPYMLDEAIDPAVPPQFHRFPGTTVTVCLLTLRNGFTVVGESAAVSLANFNEDIGRTVAFKNAREKLWPLLGFALKEQIAEVPALVCSRSVEREG